MEGAPFSTAPVDWASSDKNKQPAKILIVEDDLVIARTLSSRLQDAGYQIAASLQSGEDALKLSIHRSIDLVLMDMSLGGKLDGISTAYELRERHNIPAIFLTAKAGPETVERAKSARPLGYLLKPYAKEDLFHTIELALNTRRIEERLQKRESQFRYFSEATEILLSLDPQTMLRDLAEFTLPRLGDFCFIETISPHTGYLYRLATSHINPSLRRELRENTSNVSVERALDYPAVIAMSKAESVFEPSLVPYLLPEYANDEPFFRQIAALACTSLICLPLVTNGKALAALTLGYSSSGRQHTPESLELGKELARRATIALNHSQLHQKSLEKTEEAQRSEGLIEKLNQNLEHQVAQRTYELQNASLRLEASLKEKEVLLREVHHRVKNNLQVISSLLRLQSQTVSDPATAAVLTESQNRIRSMALIHQLLYQSKDISQIDFKKYLATLLAELFRAYNAAAPLYSYTINADDIELDLDQAIPCGLITTELVSNALNHGFAHKKAGELSISFRRDSAQRAALMVSDNGSGLPAGFEWEKSETLGFTIIHSLCKQLGGKGVFAPRPGGGTQFTFDFPLRNTSQLT